MRVLLIIANHGGGWVRAKPETGSTMNEEIKKEQPENTEMTVTVTKKPKVRTNVKAGPAVVVK
jgi:hypothetical protein